MRAKDEKSVLMSIFKTRKTTKCGGCGGITVSVNNVYRLHVPTELI